MLLPRQYEHKKMNINKYTIKSQEALQAAIELARKQGNQVIEPAHLLHGLLSVGEKCARQERGYRYLPQG